MNRRRGSKRFVGTAYLLCQLQIKTTTKVNSNNKYVELQHLSILVFVLMFYLNLKFQVNNGCANDDTNYNVKLGESTDFEEITWLFPDTNQCPMEHCALPFSHRSVAALHFRMKHAKTTMPCTLCDELILAINAQDLLQHYENMHPNEPHPELKMVSQIFN